MSTFNLDWQVDTSQIDKLVRQLQATKDNAKDAATALSGVKTNLDSATASTHEFSLANAGVVRELSVMFGEAMRGNWTRLEGSLTVLANRSGLLAMAFSPLGAAIGITTAVLGSFAYETVKADHALQQLQNSLILTNNYAGITRDRMLSLADAVGQDTNTSVSKATSVMELLARSGKFTGDQFQALGDIIVTQSKLSGESIDKVFREYEKMPDGVYKWALQHSNSMHDIDAATLQVIKRMEEHGDKAGAMALAIDNVKRHMDDAKQSAGFWASAIKVVSDTYTQFADRYLRETPLAKQIAETQEKIKGLQTQLAQASSNDPFNTLRASTKGLNDSLAQEKKHLADLMFNLAAVNQVAAQQGQKAQADRQLKDTLKLADAYGDQRKTLAKRNEELQKYDDLIKKGRSEWNSQHPGEALPKELQDDVVSANRQHIIDRYTDRKGASIDYQDGLAKEREAERLDQEKKREYIEQLRISFEQGTIDQRKYIADRAAAEQSLINQTIAHNEVMIGLANKRGAQGKVEADKLTGENEVLRERLKTVGMQEQADLKKLTNAERDDLANRLRTWQNFSTNLQNTVNKRYETRNMTTYQAQDFNDQQKIKQDYENELAKINIKYQDGKKDADAYKQAITDLDAAYARNKQILADGVKERTQLDQDWVGAAKNAFNQYMEDAGNTANQTKQLFSDAFSGLNNALLNFVETGKLNFGDLTKKVIEDLIMMEIKAKEVQIFKAMQGSGGTGSMLSSIAGFFGFADGGVFDKGLSMFASGEVVNGPRFFAGGAGLMGEQNPEAIMPLKRGADGRLGVSVQGGQPTQNVMTFDMSVNVSGNASEDTVKQLQQQQAKQMQLIKGMIISEINNQQRPRGALSNVR